MGKCTEGKCTEECRIKFGREGGRRGPNLGGGRGNPRAPMVYMKHWYCMYIVG